MQNKGLQSKNSKKVRYMKVAIKYNAGVSGKL